MLRASASPSARHSLCDWLHGKCGLSLLKFLLKAPLQQIWVQNYYERFSEGLLKIHFSKTVQQKKTHP
jgi:hypothetical protein